MPDFTGFLVGQRVTRNQAYGQLYRGFESHPFRQTFLAFPQIL